MRCYKSATTMRVAGQVPKSRQWHSITRPLDCIGVSEAAPDATEPALPDLHPEPKPGQTAPSIWKSRRSICAIRVLKAWNQITGAGVIDHHRPGPIIRQGFGDKGPAQGIITLVKFEWDAATSTKWLVDKPHPTPTIGAQHALDIHWCFAGNALGRQKRNYQPRSG